MNNDNWAVRVRRMKIEMRPGDNKVYTFLLKGRGKGVIPMSRSTRGKDIFILLL